MKKGIFEPLGLKNTTLPGTAATPDPVLHAHTGERGVWEDSTFWDPSWTWYAGGIRSNLDDLRTFLEALGTGKLLDARPATRSSSPAPRCSPTPTATTRSACPWSTGGCSPTRTWRGTAARSDTSPSKKLTVDRLQHAHATVRPGHAASHADPRGITKVLNPDQPVNPPS